MTSEQDWTHGTDRPGTGAARSEEVMPGLEKALLDLLESGFGEIEPEAELNPLPQQHRASARAGWFGSWAL